MATKNDVKQKLERILKFALEESEGIINPKQLIDNNLIKNYQEWAKIMKKIKEYSIYEFRELKIDELKIYNITSYDNREKYYIIIDIYKRNQAEAYIKLLKSENDPEKKLQLIKNIINPNKGFVKYLRSISKSHIEDFLKNVIMQLYDLEKQSYGLKEFWNIIPEYELASFFINCLKNFNLNNEIKKEIAEFALLQFKRIKKDIIPHALAFAKDLENDLKWYELYLFSYQNIFSDLPTPDLNTILKWGEEDMAIIDTENSDDEYSFDFFIEFYKNLLISHIKNIDENEFNKQKLRLNYEYILKKETDKEKMDRTEIEYLFKKINKPYDKKEEYKKIFYSFFENLDNWEDWEKGTINFK